MSMGISGAQVVNHFDLMRAAIREAEQTMKAADDQAGAMAGILRGRLRKVPRHILAELKRELRDFNIQTKCWKEER